MPAAKRPKRAAKPKTETAAKPGAEKNPVVVEFKGDADALTEAVASRSKRAKVYVAVDALSWRPHPLPRGTEVSEILPAAVIEANLALGHLTREAPDQAT